MQPLSPCFLPLPMSLLKLLNVNNAQGNLVNLTCLDQYRFDPCPVYNSQDVRFRNTEELEASNIWKLKEITEPSQLRSLRLPDTLSAVRIVRLMYVNSGNDILALCCNAVHKLWRWKNTTGNAIDAMPSELRQPFSGILKKKDMGEANWEPTFYCLALSKNNSFVLSASGGEVTLFNLVTFKTMLEFASPPPAARCVAFHPQDNNIIIMGMSDSSIHVYNVRLDMVVKKIMGHQKCVTGLAFSTDKKILVSSGADTQLCVWKTDSWEMHVSKILKTLPGQTTTTYGLSETGVRFSPDQTHLLVIHRSQIAIYDPLKLECLMQWFPPQASSLIADAVYSCDGKSIFVGTDDGNVSVLIAKHLIVKCWISPNAYMLPSSILRVFPASIAAHPSRPNQFALGLSDGGVCVLEPLESDTQWGPDPS